MTTTARPAPKHGERACYLRGCRRPECTAANYRYMSRLRLEHERGERRRTTPDNALARITQLLAAGWNHTQIAEASGASRHAIGAIIRGTFPTISGETERRILAVEPGPPPPPRDTDPTGTVRRVRALVAIGHPIAHIAATVGMHRDALSKVVRSEFPRVRVTTAEAVAAAYRQLALTPGTSQRARNLAKTRGWHGPMAWDDTTIDDPNAQPEVDDTAPATRNELAQVIAEEIQHLARFGLSTREIAKRVDRSEKYVSQQLTGERRPGWRQQLEVAA